MSLPHFFIGYDISKAHLDIYDSRDGRLCRIANTDSAVCAWLKTAAPCDRTLVVFEATGPYDRVIRDAAHRQGVACVRVNPQQARDFARALGRRAKTDARDAKALAAMGQALRLTPQEAPDPTRQRLALLAKRRDQLVAIAADEKKRLKEMAGEECIADSLKAVTLMLAGQIKALDEAISALIDTRPDLARSKRHLCSMPGIGPVTATTLVSRCLSLAGSTTNSSPPWPASPRSTTTAAPSRPAPDRGRAPPRPTCHVHGRIDRCRML